MEPSRKDIRKANKGLRQARRERAKGVKEQGQENYSYDGYEKGRYNKKGDDIEYGKTKRYSKFGLTYSKAKKRSTEDISTNKKYAPREKT